MQDAGTGLPSKHWPCWPLLSFTSLVAARHQDKGVESSQASRDLPLPYVLPSPSELSSPPGWRGSSWGPWEAVVYRAEPSAWGSWEPRQGGASLEPPEPSTRLGGTRLQAHAASLLCACTHNHTHASSLACAHTPLCMETGVHAGAHRPRSTHVCPGLLHPSPSPRGWGGHDIKTPRLPLAMWAQPRCVLPGVPCSPQRHPHCSWARRSFPPRWSDAPGWANYSPGAPASSTPLSR